MRCFATALVLALAIGPASAQTRLVTPRITCADAMAVVKHGGDVTIAVGTTEPERIVRDRSYCDLSEIAELRLVPTRDNPQCPIGYRCREPGFEEWNW